MAAFALAFGQPVTALASNGPELPTSRPQAKFFLANSKEFTIANPSQYLPKAQQLAIELQQGPNGDAYPVQAWKKLLQNLQSATPLEKIEAVQSFFNQVPYVQDSGDSWRMPNQFLCQGGDCEDFAIAKFVTLRLLGFHADRIRILFVKNTLTGIDHAVTVVNYNRETLVLDNNLPQSVPSSAVAHYQPICSFDERRLWLHWQPGKPNVSVAALQQRVNRAS
jgi:predicted transglutaminase-like cysteine proteinase